MEFINQYNEKTKDKKGQVIPAEITVFEDRTFTFITKLPPVSELIKQKIKIKKGSSKTPSETAGTITDQQLTEVAEAKLPDLNTTNVETAKKIIAGTAHSMGIKIK